MKKILLGLGTLSLAALPVMAVVSCGGTTETKTDLGITSKFVTKTVIDKAITDYKAAATDAAKQLTALTPVFAGVTADNLKNFDVKVTESTATATGTIVLTAKDGFAFGKESTLTSKLSVDLKITNPTTDITQEVLDAAITEFLAATTDAAKQLVALSKVFAGVTADNLKNFDVKATATAGSVAGTIVLTAKEGFIFGDQPTLSSKVAASTVK